MCSCVIGSRCYRYKVDEFINMFEDPGRCSGMLASALILADCTCLTIIVVNAYVKHSVTPCGQKRNFDSLIISTSMIFCTLYLFNHFILAIIYMYEVLLVCSCQRQLVAKNIICASPNSNFIS